jgi:hypothetical protein
MADDDIIDPESFGHTDFVSEWGATRTRPLSPEVASILRGAGYDPEYVVAEEKQVDLGNPPLDPKNPLPVTEASLSRDQRWIDAGRHVWAMFNGSAWTGGPLRGELSMADDDIIDPESFGHTDFVSEWEATRTRPPSPEVASILRGADVVGDSQTRRAAALAMSDEEVSQWAKELMGWFNYHMPSMGVQYNQMRKAPEDQKRAFLTLMDLYEEKNMSWDGVLRFFKGVISDPSTYVGLSTLGIGTLVGRLGKKATKQGIRAALKASLPRAALVAVEGGSFAGTDAGVREAVKVAAGEQEKINKLNVGLAVGVGALAGGGLGAGADVGGQLLRRRKVQSALGKDAPPPAADAPPPAADAPPPAADAPPVDMGIVKDRAVQPDGLPLTPSQRSELLNLKKTHTLKQKETKVLKDLINQGVWPEKLKQEGIDFLQGMRARRLARTEAKQRQSPDMLSLRQPGHAIETYKGMKARQEREAAELEAKQKELKRVRQIQESIKDIPSRHLWNKKFAAEVDTNAELMLYGSNPRGAINKANMEAVPRILKKEGWTVRHASKGGGGRASSRYLISPDGEIEVRLSDHFLPETPQREYYREQTGGPGWYEIVLGGEEGPQEIIDDIKRILKDHIEEADGD